MSLPTSRTARRAAALALVALISVGAAACGSDDNGNGNSNNNSNGNGNGSNQANATGTTGVTGATEETVVVGVNDAVAVNTVENLRFFSPQSPWNTPVRGLPKAAESTRMLDLATQRIAVREIPGTRGVERIVRNVKSGVVIDNSGWAPYIVPAGGEGSEATEMVCRQSNCGPDDPKVPATLELPPDTTPDPRFDGWMSVIDLEKGVGYDFWRARRQADGVISFQFSKGWTLDGPGFSQPVSVDPVRAVGARGSGLPMFAGVIGPNELKSGRIDHALAISLPGVAKRNYVQPASVTNGVGSRKSVPMGARLRLRGDIRFEDSGRRNLRRDRARAADAILAALRNYGAIVVDRAAVPTLYAPRGSSPRLIRGDEIDWLSLDDFEVIQLPERLKDPPLAKVGLEGPDPGDTASSADTGAMP